MEDYKDICKEVRHDNSLSSTSKLLFLEIIDTKDEADICHLSDLDFAKIFDIRRESANRSIAALNQKKYIKIEKNEVNNRRIIII